MGIGRRRFGRPPAWLYPMAAEAAYKSDLVKVIRYIREETARIFPNLESLAEEAESQKKDAWADEINAGIKALRLSVDKKVTEKDSEALAGEVAQNIGAWNDGQWRKTMKKVMGVDIFQAEPYLRDMYSNFVAQNTSLIKSMADDAVKRVEASIRGDITAGARVGTIKKNLRKQFDISESKARLIARDQVGKLNGDLQRAKQTSVGISKYIWRTSEDERVRGTHSPLNGRVCRWDDASVYWNESSKSWSPRSNIGAVSLHPGQDYQCRCYGEPYFDDIEYEAGKEIEKQQKTLFASEKPKRKPKAPPIEKPEIKGAQASSIDSIKASISGYSKSELFNGPDGKPGKIAYKGTRKYLGVVDGFTRKMPPAYIAIFEKHLKKVAERGAKIKVPPIRGISSHAGGAIMNMGDAVLGINHDRTLAVFDHKNFGYTADAKRLKKELNEFLKNYPEEMPVYYAKHFESKEAYKTFREKAKKEAEDQIEKLKILRVAEAKEAKKTGGYPFVSEWKIGDAAENAPSNSFKYFADKEQRVASVIDHEYGHVIFQYSGFDETGKYHNMRKDAMTAYYAALKDESKFASKYMTEAQDVFNRPEEFFAESYSLHVNGRDDLLHPAILPVFEKWGL